MLDDEFYKEVVVDVNSSNDGKTVTILLTSDEAITVSDMLTALEQFIDDTDRGPGETIQ